MQRWRKVHLLHAHVAAVGQGGPGHKQEKEKEPESGTAPEEGWEQQKVHGRSPRRPKKTLVVLPLACSALASPDRVASAEKKRRVVRFNARADVIKCTVPSENTMFHYEEVPQSAILSQKLGGYVCKFPDKKHIKMSTRQAVLRAS